MWQEIVDFFLPILLLLLKQTVKNPQSKRIEGSVIAELAQVSTQADAAVNGNLWSMTPSTPITQAPVGATSASVFPVGK